MFEDIQELRADEAPDEAINRCVERGVGEARASELTAKYPQAGERAERDHDTETRDVEGPDAKEDWIQGVSTDPGGDRTHDPVIKSHMLYH